MPSSRVLLIALLALATGSCVIGPPDPQAGPTAAPSPTDAAIDRSELPECVYPEKVKTPGWVPDDLPLPQGTYTTDRLSPIQGYRRTLLVVQRTLEELTEFVLERFPEEGWIVGRGDTEPGELDMQFSKTPAVGAFRAIEQFCRPGFALVLLLYAPDRSEIEAPVPISPRPDATPIG